MPLSESKPPVLPLPVAVTFVTFTSASPQTIVTVPLYVALIATDPPFAGAAAFAVALGAVVV